MKIPRLDVTITISGQDPIAAWLRFPAGFGFGVTPFPGPIPQTGEIHTKMLTSTFDGFTFLSTRTYAQCPSNGNFRAMLEPFDFLN